MKQCFFILLILISAFIEKSNAQMLSMEDETLGNIDQICIEISHGLGFSTSKAESMFAEICRVLNLENSTINIQACSNFSGSARAVLSKKNSARYLLYNPERFREMENQEMADWAAYFIFAHEVAHHIYEHLLNLNKSQYNHSQYLAVCREYELAADKFAGHIIRLLDGDIHKAMECFETFHHPSEQIEHLSDHPILAKRKKAAIDGYNLGSNTPVTPAAAYSDIFQDITDYALLKFMDAEKTKGIVRKYVAANYFPVGLTYSGENYYMLCQKYSTEISYSVYWDFDEPPIKELQQDVNNGYYIEQFDLVNGKWFVVLLKNPSWKPNALLKYVSRFDFDNVSGPLRGLLEQSYYFKNIVPYGDGFYVLLEKSAFSEKIKSSTYFFVNNTEEYKQWVSSAQMNDPHPVIRKRMGDRLFYFVVSPVNNTFWNFFLINLTPNQTEKFSAIAEKLEDGYFLNSMYSTGTLIEFNLWKW